MYFDAETNGIKYNINVNETRKHWKVGIKTEEKDWVYYDIPKEDYQYLDDTISLIFNNSSYLVDVRGAGTNYDVYTRGSYRSIKIYNEEELLHESLKKGGTLGGGADLASGMPGKIVKVFVKPGDEVKEGDPLLIMEAMKMENEMRATSDVKIKEVKVSVGDNVEGGSVLITFES